MSKKAVLESEGIRYTQQANQQKDGIMSMTSQQRRVRIAELELELAELRRQELCANGADCEALLEQCRTLKRDGKPVEAIKHYRNACGSTLVEARDAVIAL